MYFTARIIKSFYFNTFRLSYPSKRISVENQHLLRVFNIYKYNSRFSSSLRGNYNTLNINDIEYFQSVLASSRIIQEPNELDMYNTDWLKSHKGN